MHSCYKWILRIGILLIVAAVIILITFQSLAWTHAVDDKSTCSQHVCDVPPDDNLSPPLLATLSSHYDKLTARYISDLIVRLYQGHSSSPPLLTLKTVLNTHTSKYAVGSVHTLNSNPSVHWVSFRGSDSLTEFILDMATHQDFFSPFRTITSIVPPLNMLLSPLKYYEKKQHRSVKVPLLLQNQTAEVQNYNNIRVHSGFYSIYKRFRDSLLASLQNASTVFIGGHSMGGALASIAAMDIVLNVPSVTRMIIYTFGAPRAGNIDFATTLQKAPVTLQYFQLQNTCDIIPAMPFAVMPNTWHPKHPNYYQHGGTVLTYSDNWESFVLNHYMSNYINALSTDRIVV
jgi:hypothetical protein